jgi:CheY-like chemotaxis protein
MDGTGKLTIRSRNLNMAANEVGDIRAGEYLCIEVIDTGCGMTPEVLERVFEPFFTTKPVGKGTGLGLSQLFAFIRQSEGEIAITSTPGEGTTVTLYLPRRLTEAAVIAPTSAAPEPRPPAPSGLNILVVEDDPRVLTGTMSALTELGHYPIACGDPLAAEGLLDAHAIDLVMSDVLMPGRTGPELIASLAPLHPHLAVLFVTGYGGDAASDALAGHIVLRKPFTHAALERAVGEARAVARPAAAGQIAAE